MQSALARHDEILRDTVKAFEGHVFKTVGDAFCCGFAVALATQRALVGEP